jgi:hypothetical protein
MISQKLCAPSLLRIRHDLYYISPEKPLVDKGFQIIYSTRVEEPLVLGFSLRKAPDAATLGQKRPLAKIYLSPRPKCLEKP